MTVCGNINAHGRMNNHKPHCTLQMEEIKSFNRMTLFRMRPEGLDTFSSLHQTSLFNH